VQRGLLGPVRPLPAPPGRRSLGGLHLRQLTRAVDGARGRLGAALRALVAEVARRNPAVPVVPVVPGVPGVRAVAAHRGQHSGLVRGTRRYGGQDGRLVDGARRDRRLRQLGRHLGLGGAGPLRPPHRALTGPGSGAGARSRVGARRFVAPHPGQHRRLVHRPAGGVGRRHHGRRHGHRVRCLGVRRRAGGLPPRAGLRRGGRLLREPPGLLGAAQRLLGLALLLQAERLGLGPQPGLLLGLLAAAVLLRLAAGLLLGACLLLREEPLPLLLGAAGGFLGALPGLLRLPFRLTPLGLLELAPLALLLLGTQARELLLALTLQSLLLGLARRLFLRLAAGFLL